MGAGDLPSDFIRASISQLSTAVAGAVLLSTMHNTRSRDSQDTAPGYLQLVPPVPTYHKVNGATSQLKYRPGNMIN